MLNDDVLKLAGSLLVAKIYDRYVVQKITVWFTRTESMGGSLNMRVDFPSNTYRVGMELAHVPENLIGPLDEAATQLLLDLVTTMMARHVEVYCPNVVKQNAILEVLPMSKTADVP